MYRGTSQEDVRWRFSSLPFPLPSSSKWKSAWLVTASPRALQEGEDLGCMGGWAGDWSVLLPECCAPVRGKNKRDSDFCKKFATILCGVCGMKCCHVEKSPLQVFHLGNCRRLHLEETSPGCQSGNQPTISALEVLKGRELFTLSCLFVVCCFTREENFRYIYKTPLY